MVDALRIRDFRLLWVGRFVSLLGSSLLWVAVPAHVYALTGSAVATGLTVAAESAVPIVLGPFAGVLADRWDRRRMMLAADAFRAVVVATMLWADRPELLWIVYVALVGESVGTLLFRPAAQAHVPAVVGTGSRLASANSLTAFTDGVGTLLGAPLGGLLYATAGIEAVILADTASYLASAVAVALMSRRQQAEQPSAGRRDTGRRGRAARTAHSVRADLRGGLRFLRGQPVALALLPATALFLLANAALTALLVPFGTRLGGSTQIGVVLSGLGAGHLLGAPASRLLVERVSPARLVPASHAATGVGFLALVNARTLWPAVAAGVAVGASGAVALVAARTTVARVTPNPVLGRVSAVFLTSDAAASLLGALLGPALAGLATLTWALNLSGGLALVAGALGVVLLTRTTRGAVTTGAADHPNAATPASEP